MVAQDTYGWYGKGTTLPHWDPAVFVKPILQITFVTSCITLSAIFFLTRQLGYFKTEKQSAWILTSISSLVMSVGSLPYLIKLLFFDYGDVLRQPTASDTLSQMFLAYFVAYLVTDLAIGQLFYKKQLGFLTCYVHHSVYVGIVSYVLAHNLASVFVMASILELPTFILSAGHLHKPLRKDFLFASTFFATRIAFHMFLISAYFTNYMRSAYPTLAPSILLSMVLPLHLFWFWGFIKQQSRIRASKRVAVGQARSSRRVFGPVQAQRLLKLKKRIEEARQKRRQEKAQEKQREERHAGARVVAMSTSIDGKLIESVVPTDRKVLGQIGRQISGRIQTLKIRTPSWRTDSEGEDYFAKKTTNKPAVVAF